jgi:hypothetical protein
MADHLIGKSWGLSGALITALLTLALIAPAGAEAAGPGMGALAKLAALVPAPAQSAVSAALSQVSSASGAAASGTAMPESPPPVHVVVPPPPSVPALARPTPPPASANPVPAAPLPVPVPGGVAGLAVSVPAESVPRPDAAVQAALTEQNPSSTTRPDAALGGRTPAHRLAHRRAHRHEGAPRSVSAASTRRAPIARTTTATRPLSPLLVLEPSRRGTQPAAPARRGDSRSESRRARQVAPPRSRPGVAVTAAPLAFPPSAALPPGGSEGSAAGAGGAATGAAAATLLALFGLCILRALLPGLLGLGLAPARSAFLVSRLERPG